jgi:hypothetical protein
MKRLLRFVNLERSERRLLLKTVFVVVLVRLGLWMLPFKILRVVLARFEKAGNRPGGAQPPETLDRLTWALKIAGRTVPAASCLTQALAGALILCRNGYRPTLRLGVTKNKSGKFLAHAWLEHEGAIVIGDLRDLSRYASFPPVDLHG